MIMSTPSHRTHARRENNIAPTDHMQFNGTRSDVASTGHGEGSARKRTVLACTVPSTEIDLAEQPDRG